MRRVTAHCKTLHEQFGVGRKFGKTWVLTADEAERHRPAAKAGRPKANLKLEKQTNL
jgi:transposase